MACVECNKPLKFVRGITIERETIGNFSFSFKVPVQLCSVCGAEYMEMDVLSAIELFIGEFLARTQESRGIYLKYMRKASGLSREDISKEFYMGGEDFVVPEKIKEWEENSSMPARYRSILYYTTIREYTDKSPWDYFLGNPIITVI